MLIITLDKPSSYYLVTILLFSVFRSIVYTVALHIAVREKLTKKEWEDEENTREVMFAFCTYIRTNNYYRTAITLLGLYLPDDLLKTYFCYINLLYDLKLLHGLFTMFPGTKAMKFQNSNAISIQSTIVSIGIITISMEYFF